jgi:hypothetical protein
MRQEPYRNSKYELLRFMGFMGFMAFELPAWHGDTSVDGKPRYYANGCFNSSFGQCRSNAGHCRRGQSG